VSFESYSELYEKALSREYSRRDVLKRAIALGLSAPLVAALLAACGDDEDDEPAQPGTTPIPDDDDDDDEGDEDDEDGETPEPDDDDDDDEDDETPEPTGDRGAGGLLRLLWWQAPDILNGHLSQGTKDFDASRVSLEPLADFDENAELVPWLAEEIPSLGNGVSDDGRQVIWKLKQGVLWSDGEPFTANDVVFTYEYIMDPATTATTQGQYTGIESVEAIDDHTVAINFKEPTPGWYNVFVGPYGMILPEHVLRDYVGAEARNAPFNLNPVGTGAYKVVEFRAGDVATFEMNSLFRDPDKPYFSEVEMKGGGDATSAARASIQTGEVDFAWNLQVEAAVLEDLEATGIGVLNIFPNSNVERILVNLTDPWTEVDGERSKLGTDHPWLSDLRVRQAYALAAQRDVITEQLYGPTGRVTTNVLVGPPQFDSPNTSWEYDLDAAAALLEEAGWEMNANGVREKDGQQMSCLYQTSVNPVRQKTQEIIKDAFEELGIPTEIKAIDAGIFFSSDPGNPDTYAHFYADIQMYTNGPTSPYPLDYMLAYYGAEDNIPQQANNWAGDNVERWQNEEYDELFDMARTELEPERQAELMIAMNDLVIENIVEIPLVARNGVAGHAADLENLQLTQWASNLWNLANWSRS
jgi:peptide/nickel transport system substrate-binding protein